jgi:hypothetical protein
VDGVPGGDEPDGAAQDVDVELGREAEALDGGHERPRADHRAVGPLQAGEDLVARDRVALDVEERLRVEEDAVVLERGADLVGPARLLGVPAQVELGGAALRDVRDLQRPAREAPVRVAHGGARDLEPVVAELLRIPGARVEQPADRLPGELGVRPADDPAQGRVAGDPAVALVDERHGDRGVVERPVQQLLAATEARDEVRADERDRSEGRDGEHAATHVGALAPIGDGDVDHPGRRHERHVQRGGARPHQDEGVRRGPQVEELDAGADAARGPQRQRHRAGRAEQESVARPGARDAAGGEADHDRRHLRRHGDRERRPRVVDPVVVEREPRLDDGAAREPQRHERGRHEQPGHALAVLGREEIPRVRPARHQLAVRHLPSHRS